MKEVVSDVLQPYHWALYLDLSALQWAAAANAPLFLNSGNLNLWPDVINISLDSCQNKTIAHKSAKVYFPDNYIELAKGILGPAQYLLLLPIQGSNLNQEILFLDYNITAFKIMYINIC